MISLKSIAAMSPDLLVLYKQFEAAMAKAGLPFILTSVARTVKEQAALYCQGRDPLSIVNAMRKAAGMTSIKQADNKKVTWTLMSKHIIDLEDGIEANNWSRAFDIAITDGKIPTWNTKVNVNKNEIPDYEEAGKIGKSIGLVWGGDFKKTPDYPHFQLGV